LWLLLAVQGLPVPIILCYLLFGSLPPVGVFPHFWLLGLNVFLVAGFVFRDRTFLRYNWGIW